MNHTFFSSRIRNQLTNQEFKVFYVGTNNGRIYKIVQFIQNGQSKSKLLDIFEIAQNEAIQVIEISQKYKSLYVSTDHRIKQIDLEMCNHRYDSCFRCVKDPYCGWDHEGGACKPYKLGLLQVRRRQDIPLRSHEILSLSCILSYQKTLTILPPTGYFKRNQRHLRLKRLEE